MKPPAGVFTAIVVLSLVAWTLMRLFVPGPPLDGTETMVLVGACAGAVLLGRWIWGRLRKGRGNDGGTP